MYIWKILYVWLYVWIISFKKRGKWEIIELVCFPPASRLIWGWGIWWWGQKWSRTKIYEWDSNLTVHNSIFSHLGLLSLKLAFKIIQNSSKRLYRACLLDEFQTKDKGECKQSLGMRFYSFWKPKMSKNVQKCPKYPVRGLDSHSSPGCTHKSLF